MVSLLRENKESCSSPCAGDAGVERRSKRLAPRSMPGGRDEEREHLEKTLLLFKLKGAWLTLRQVTLL